jgi:DNA primase
MPRLKESCKQDLKLRINIVDVISRVATPRRAGGNRFKALCPFHQEKTPSFHFDSAKGFYKCFGCGKSGDIFTFVQETEGLNFTEAVEALAQRFNVALEYEEGGGGPSREERSLRQELFDLHEFAADHLHQAFKANGEHGAWMRDYWTKDRRFTPELAEEFKIGLADPAGSGLAAALMRKKFSEAALRQCGLFFIYEDQLLTLQALRPRFRGRLMIPIRDHQGRVVAFTARQTKLTPADDPAHEAKYVNSPETPIFTKGNLLFNLDRARAHVGDGKPFVMVEGQLDALRCWSVGLKTAIAPQGTSITEGQLILMRRYHTELECFFDSDSAGQKAALRLLPLALKTGIEVRFLTLDGAGKVDPDLLFLEKGLAGYDEVKRGAFGGMQFMRRYVLPDARNATAERTQAAVREIYSVIAAADSELLRKRLLGEVAPALGALQVTPDILERDFAQFIAKGGRPAAQSAPASPPASADSSGSSRPTPGSALQDDPTAPERDLLLLVLHFDIALGRALAATCPHEWIEARLPSGVLLNRFLGEFLHGEWPGRDNLDGLLETDAERALVASLLFETPQIDDPAKVALEGLKRLRDRALAPRLRQIDLQLAQASTDNTIDAIALLKERSELQRLLAPPLRLSPSPDNLFVFRRSTPARFRPSLCHHSCRAKPSLPPPIPIPTPSRPLSRSPKEPKPAPPIIPWTTSLPAGSTTRSAPSSGSPRSRDTSPSTTSTRPCPSRSRTRRRSITSSPFSKIWRSRSSSPNRSRSSRPGRPRRRRTRPALRRTTSSTTRSACISSRWARSRC